MCLSLGLRFKNGTYEAWVRGGAGFYLHLVPGIPALLSLSSPPIASFLHCHNAHGQRHFLNVLMGGFCAQRVILILKVSIQIIQNRFLKLLRGHSFKKCIILLINLDNFNPHLKEGLLE